MNVKHIVGELRKDLGAGLPRSKAWSRVADNVPSLRWLIRRHVRDLQLLERLKRAKGYSAPLRTRSVEAPKPRRGGICRGCGEPKASHKDRVVLRRHLWIIKQRYLAHKSWRGYTPEMKRQRMEKAWAARRRRGDVSVINTVHPRLIKLLGKKSVLGRYGRA